MTKPDLATMAFRDAMEGDDRVLLDVAVDPVRVISGLKGFYRFGDHNPVVRYVGHEGEAWSRVHTFELETGEKVPYDSDTLIDRMRSGAFEEIRPLTAPVPRVREALDAAMALALVGIAGSIEREDGLKRPNARVLAREQEAGKAVLASLDEVPDGMAGIHRMRELVQAQADHAREGADLRAGMSGQPASEVRRLTLIAEELAKGAHLGITHRRMDLDDSRERLVAALGDEVEALPAGPAR